jgi:hypothetical protein
VEFYGVQKTYSIPTTTNTKTCTKLRLKKKSTGLKLILTARATSADPAEDLMIICGTATLPRLLPLIRTPQPPLTKTKKKEDKHKI